MTDPVKINIVFRKATSADRADVAALRKNTWRPFDQFLNRSIIGRAGQGSEGL